MKYLYKNFVPGSKKKAYKLNNKLLVSVFDNF